MASRSDINAKINDAEKVSFGRYLGAIRQKRGIALEAVAEEIRVSPRQLAWIEAEDHERMPAEVYTKGILRAYARVLGVDPDDIVERYRIHRRMYENSLRLEAQALGAGKKALPRTILALSVLGIVVALSLYGYHVMESGRKEHGRDKTGPSALERKEPGRIGVEGHALSWPEHGRDKAGPSTGRCPQLLLIDAVSEVTIHVRVDGGKPVKYVLDPNDHVELAAQSFFYIRLSDPGGVRLRFNGQPVEMEAGPGKPASLVLPKESGN